MVEKSQVLEDKTVLEERVDVVDITDLKKMREKKKLELENTIKEIDSFSNGYDPNLISKKIDEQKKQLKKAGINDEQVPEFLKTAYFEVYNLIKSPEKRLSNKEKEVKEFSNKIKEIISSIEDRLYGKDYEKNRGKIGGLHGEYKKVADKRFKISSAMVNIDEYIKDLYEDLKKCNTAIETNQNPDTIKEIYDQGINTKYEINKKEAEVKKLGTQLDNCDYNLGVITKEMTALEHLNSFLQEIHGELDATLNTFRNTKEIGDYTKIIATLIPSLKDKANKYLKMVKAFKEANYEELKNVVDLTKEKPTFEKDDIERPNPFTETLQRSEEANELRMQRAREILKNPFGDIYKKNKFS